MRRTRRGYVPALDGLRAISVLLVFAFHTPFGRFPLGDGLFRGGYLGVDVFFVLSGFLITSIVLDYPGLDRATLTDFYERRIRRLLPALLATVAACLGIAVFVQSWPEMVATLESIPGALGYWTNVSAATAVEPKTTILAHTWSLAMEFQYYLVWPIVLLVLRRRLSPLPLLLLTVVFIEAITAWRAVQSMDGNSFERVYFGPDTRFDALLVGSALALFLAWRPNLQHGVSRIAADAAGVASLCGIVLLAMTTKLETLWLYERGGLTAVALLAALLVHAILVEPNGVCASLFRLPPLVAIGRISYSLYLWHWPVVFATASLAPDWSFAALTAMRLAVSFTLAVLSYALIERTARRRPSNAPMPRAAVGSVAISSAA